MNRFLLLLWVVLAAAPNLVAAPPMALFYMTRSPDSIRSFLAHSSQIDLLVPTWYQVDENGLVTGAPDPAVLKRAHDEKLAVMPIVALMNKKEFHALVTSPAAQLKMNEALIRLVQTKAFDALIDADSAESLPKMGTMIAKLSKAAVDQKKWMSEIRAKTTQAADDVVKVAKAGGMSEAKAEEIKQRILGIV